MLHRMALPVGWGSSHGSSRFGKHWGSKVGEWIEIDRASRSRFSARTENRRVANELGVVARLSTTLRAGSGRAGGGGRVDEPGSAPQLGAGDAVREVCNVDTHLDAF